MQTHFSDVDILPTAIFDPDLERGEWLATQLEEEGFAVEMANSADDLLASVRKTYFRTLVVVADLSDSSCLRFLDDLRRVSPRSWLIVANTIVSEPKLELVHRHGIDALLAAPIYPEELARRIAAFRLHSRPSF